MDLVSNPGVHLSALKSHEGIANQHGTYGLKFNTEIKKGNRPS